MDSLRTLVIVWLVLLLLLALSVASAYVDLGTGNLVANIGIATIKAALVAWFYMHLRHGTPALRVAALIGLIWLLFLIGLSLADHLTRPTHSFQPLRPVGALGADREIARDAISRKAVIR